MECLTSKILSYPITVVIIREIATADILLINEMKRTLF